MRRRIAWSQRARDAYLDQLRHIAAENPIAYEIVVEPDGSEAIVILHIVHGARDWPPERWPA